MNRSPKFIRAMGFTLFIAGILLGMFLSGGLTWANLEADFYFGYGVQGESALQMTCPLVMAADETGQVAISVHNPTDRAVEPLLQVDISGRLGRSFRERLPIEAGTSVTASWEVGSRDVVFGHLILSKIYQFAARGLPSADAACGILVLTVGGLSGRSIYLLALSGSALLAALGFLLWLAGYRLASEGAPNEAGGMLLLAGIVGIGILVSSLGWWVPGLLAMAASVLLTAILIARQVNARR